jgi:hypothetical protein
MDIITFHPGIIFWILLTIILVVVIFLKLKK